MASAWDRHTDKSVAAMQDELLQVQIRDSVAPFSPLWRRRFAELGRKPAAIKSTARPRDAAADGGARRQPQR